jgi:2-aminoadipate transaminase
VLEDNPYGLLRYEGEPLPTLRSLEAAGSNEDNDFVIYTGTMSKILSPGVRVGWLAAPRPLLAKLILGKQSADLCSSTLAQHFVAAYFASGDWRAYVESLREVYHRRRDVILDALAEHLPAQASWTRPQGGLFIWVTLPDYIDTTDLLARALAENVAFVPGEAAFADGRGHGAMRLNFSSSVDEDIREGVRRIGKIVAEQVALYDTLTGRPARAEHAGDGGGGGAAMADILELPRRGALEGRRSREA